MAGAHGPDAAAAADAVAAGVHGGRPVRNRQAAHVGAVRTRPPRGGRHGRLVGCRDGAGPPGRLHQVAAHGVRCTHRAGRVPGLGQPPLRDIRLYRVPARVRAGQPVADRRLRCHRAGGVRGNGRRLPVGECGADGYLPGSGRGAGSAHHELGQHHQPGAGAESGARRDDQRTGRGEPPAGSLDGRECRSCTPSW